MSVEIVSHGDIKYIYKNILAVSGTFFVQYSSLCFFMSASGFVSCLVSYIVMYSFVIVLFTPFPFALHPVLSLLYPPLLL